MKRSFACGGPLLLLAFRCLGCEGLAVEHAWIREAPPGAPVLAGYGELINTSADTLVIEGLSSPGHFGHVMVHETVLEDGSARMLPRATLEIPGGARIELAPGGMHLMLMHPVSDQGMGATIPVEFQCGTAARVLEFPVLREAP